MMLNGMLFAMLVFRGEGSLAKMGSIHRTHAYPLLCVTETIK